MFARSILDQGEIERLLASDLDEEDAKREPLLRAILRHPVVDGIAHPGIDPPDVLQVFLTMPSDPRRVFACAVVCEARLRRMLDEAPFVVEGFALQVAPGSWITSDALRAALEAWAARNFPDLPLPRFRIEPWLDPREVASDALDDALRPVPAQAVPLPAEWTPAATVAVPPLEHAA